MFFYIGLGSNVGNREKQLLAAIHQLATQHVVLKQSSIYETSPWGEGPSQPDYLNAAILLYSRLSPLELLQSLLHLEEQFGRVRHPGVKNEPRTLDLDILLMGLRGEKQVNYPDLVIPHPRLHLRTFVLRPLLDLDKTLVHPVLQVSLQELYQQL